MWSGQRRLRIPWRWPLSSNNFLILYLMITICSAPTESFRKGFASAESVIGETDANITTSMVVIYSGYVVGGTGPSPPSSASSSQPSSLGPLGGIRYRTSSGGTGYTQSVDGRFDYKSGTDTFIVFSIGFVQLGVLSLSSPPPSSPWLITPFDWAGTGRSCIVNDRWKKIITFLYSLDSDRNPINSIQIAPYPFSNNQTDIASLTYTQLDSYVRSLTGAQVGLVDPIVAIDAFITFLDNETWEQVGYEMFPLLYGGGAQKTQGASNDGVHWYFNWQFGLQRTSEDFSVERRNTPAIPKGFRQKYGSSHIGDHDYMDGILYTGIEDGTNDVYQNPIVALFDAATLRFTGRYYLVPVEIQGRQGIPWVAVDKKLRILYATQWDPIPAIYLYDIDRNMTYLRTIQLNTVIRRIQGGKVFEGMLYGASDNSQKDVVKINLETGTVIRLFGLSAIDGMPLGEAEGLTFRDYRDGSSSQFSQMHTLDILDNVRGVFFRHHARTVLPLRKTLCQS